MPSSSQVAANLISELIAQGVRDIVVCPGSRSQALALMAFEAEKMGLCRLHVRVDERSAAFFALGIAQETGIPAPVIVTSGTAVANLLPAVMEADSARVPMILLTADRPPSMRGLRSNQTVAKPVALQPFTRMFVDIAAEDFNESIAAKAYEVATNKRHAGVSQINISFVEPLSEAEVTLEIQDAAQLPDLAEPSADIYVHSHTGAHARAVIIAGDKAGADAEEFAHRSGLPLLAEPSSGARFGREAVQHWETLLNDSELQQMVQRIIVFGHPTLTRTVPFLVRKIDTVVIDSAPQEAERFNPGHAVGRFATAADIEDGYDARAMKPWLGEWIIRDRQLRQEHTTIHEPDLEAAKQTGYKERSAYARAEVARMRKPITREYLTETLWLTTWPHDRLVLASSRLVRVLNKTAAPRNIKVFANRGLAGIDGTIATAQGIAVASQTREDPRLAAGTTRLLIGDLAFFHDAGSLALQANEYHPRLQIIVGNDGGGTIFDTLEVHETADPEAYERVMRTPQNIDIEALAKAYGYEYRFVQTEGELENLFTEPVPHPQIVEVKLNGND